MRSETARSSAIRRLVRPRAASRRTSTSRSVRSHGHARRGRKPGPGQDRRDRLLVEAAVPGLRGEHVAGRVGGVCGPVRAGLGQGGEDVRGGEQTRRGCQVPGPDAPVVSAAVAALVVRGGQLGQPDEAGAAPHDAPVQ